AGVRQQVLSLVAQQALDVSHGASPRFVRIPTSVTRYSPAAGRVRQVPDADGQVPAGTASGARRRWSDGGTRGGRMGGAEVGFRTEAGPGPGRGHVQATNRWNRSGGGAPPSARSTAAVMSCWLMYMDRPTASPAYCERRWTRAAARGQGRPSEAQVQLGRVGTCRRRSRARSGGAAGSSSGGRP